MEDESSSYDGVVFSIAKYCSRQWFDSPDAFDNF